MIGKNGLKRNGSRSDQHSHGGALFGNIKAIPFENLMDSPHAVRKMKHFSVQTATSGSRDVGFMIINEKHYRWIHCDFCHSS